MSQVNPGPHTGSRQRYPIIAEVAIRSLIMQHSDTTMPSELSYVTLLIEVLHNATEKREAFVGDGYMTGTLIATAPMAARHVRRTAL